MTPDSNISLACFLLATTCPALAEWPEAKIMPLGDSITRGTNDINHPRGSIPGGYRKELGNSLAAASLDYDFVGHNNDNAAPGMDPDHNGTNGFRTDQILEKMDLWLTTNPDVVLLKAGTNDILQERQISDAVLDLNSLIEKITVNAPNRHLYVSTLLPITQPWNGVAASTLDANANAYNAQVRDIVAQFAAQGRKVKLVDMNTSIVLTNPDPSKNFFQPGDGIHPGQAGYDQMSQIWFNAITGEDSYFQTPPPGSPGTPGSLVAAVFSGSEIRLNWVDNSTDETGFKLERKTGAEGIFTQIAVLPPDTTSFRNTGLGNDTQFIYRIRAINAVSHSPYGNESSATTSTTVGYDAWSVRFPEFSALPVEDRMPLADPNQDGVSNLCCYAFNLDPMAAVSAEDRPCIRWVAGEMENQLLPLFQFRRSKTAPLSMDVQISTLMVEESWQVLGQEAATVEVIEDDDLTERVLVPLPTDSQNRFARLKIRMD